MLSVLSPCKINLFLYITGKRPDGFHNLQSLFCLLDQGDMMHFEVADDEAGTIEITPDMGFPVEQNLIYKAAKLLQEETHKNFSMRCAVEKKLPMGGGLGGGSSNAATTLLVLNDQLKLGLTIDTLCDLGAKLGSDVPFFVRGRPAFVEGRGEILHPVELKKAYYLVVTPHCHISTKDIFTDAELKAYYSPVRTFDDLMHQPFANDCLSIVKKKFCEVGQVLDSLVKYGNASMSGTGASCFVSFPDLEQARAAQAALSGLDAQVMLATSLNQSPVHQALSSAI